MMNVYHQKACFSSPPSLLLTPLTNPHNNPIPTHIPCVRIWTDLKEPELDCWYIDSMFTIDSMCHSVVTWHWRSLRWPMLNDLWMTGRTYFLLNLVYIFVAFVLVNVIKKWLGSAPWYLFHFHPIVGFPPNGMTDGRILVALWYDSIAHETTHLVNSSERCLRCLIVVEDVFLTVCIWCFRFSWWQMLFHNITDLFVY